MLFALSLNDHFGGLFCNNKSYCRLLYPAYCTAINKDINTDLIFLLCENKVCKR